LAALQLAQHYLFTPCAKAKDRDIKDEIADAVQPTMAVIEPLVTTMGFSGLMGFCVARALKVLHMPSIRMWM
jgi:hypothetical protein